MKKTIKLAVVAALALGATSAFATNGAALIGMGAKARGMAGTGIGMSHGAESALVNPALITSVENTEISFGGTIFMPDVKNTNDLSTIGDASASADSDADLNVIPEVSLATKINDNFYVGIGMWGTGGMGVDYRKAPTNAQMYMVTNLQLMQFGVPLAYTTDGFTVAVTPILQYGSLDINYVGPTAYGNPAKGAGVAQDLKLGYNIGLSYEISGLTVGAIYKSKIDMEYDGVLSKTVDLFSSTGKYNNDKLSTPAEIGIGASYAIGEHTVAIDYKQIKWSDAKGYEDFEWDDQNVVALGYEYNTKGWAVRLGYNYASSPISEQKYTGGNSANLSANVVNTFNLLGFPGIVESHYAIGGSYDVSDKASVDVAYTYAAENTETYTNFAGAKITTKHSQQGVSLQLNYNF
ncbi:OmpP1/FadL family transporter [Sulfurimonas autotrophica]|uniref:Membrane protein involved in aromatic hydrocarbon degradation n=1 Tax=Sulfurimonas autotrophica (strain ATCC BAA-671 / DSM 16294 / JCM 11897 / OK10) TaxID=563040 RepID=E0US80_SULAO|nr:outer membrane protein transport protein [Sulfurimonas autotrophica]ADN10173.1 membrane protein involved in aromatic hydrocarbon degradation [Sulfurimonas autotrophica DSM 16294]